MHPTSAITGASVAVASMPQGATVDRVRVQMSPGTQYYLDAREVMPSPDGELLVARGLHVLQLMRQNQIISTHTIDVGRAATGVVGE